MTPRYSWGIIREKNVCWARLGDFYKQPLCMLRADGLCAHAWLDNKRHTPYRANRVLWNSVEWLVCLALAHRRACN